MKIVCISDTHNQHRGLNLPDGDILIHAGDFSMTGKLTEITAFHDWFSKLPFKHKIMIAGNHDFLFEEYPEEAKTLINNIIYLEDSGIEVEGLKFWGSPVSPRFYDWAFNRDRGIDIKRHWDMIPKGIDVLIIHCPPYGILDSNVSGESVGCQDLLERINLVQPKAVIFGHIHEGYGILKKDGIIFVNACSVNEKYKLLNEPITIEI